MRAYVMSILLAGSVAFLIVAPPTPVSPDGTPRAPNVVRGSPEAEAEIARIRAHFDTVLTELDARDLASLTASQRATRASLVATLRAYRDAGAFPKNYDFPDRFVPQFVDRKTGVRCAVAHLLESTGRSDIVSRVRASHNDVFVADLAGDTAFTAWLDASGLTLDEAARIQPAYGGVTVSESDHTYRNASAVALSASAVTTFYNLSTNRSGTQSAANTLGLVVGTSTLALGLLGQQFDGASNKLAVANGGVGAATIFVAARGIWRRARAPETPPTAASPATDRAPREGIQASVSPTLSVSGPRSVGFALHVRF